MADNGNLVIVSQAKAVDRSLENFKENLKAPMKLAGADIGHHFLNVRLGGHMRKKVTTIAGRSGHGKTATTIPMFDAGSRVVSGKRPAFLFCTWEMPAEEVVERYISMKTGYSQKMLMYAGQLLDRSKQASIVQAYEEAKKLPIYYQEMSTDIDNIREANARFCEKCAKDSTKDEEIVPVLVIDYIGMAKFTGSKELRTHKLSEFMYDLKGLAKSDDCHVIPLAQINRSSDAKEHPDVADLSDSQGIEQASDNLIILYRPEYQGKVSIRTPDREISSKDKAIFRVVKGRAFGTGDILANCDIKCNRFWDEDHTHDFKYWELYNDVDFWKKQFKL